MQKNSGRLARTRCGTDVRQNKKNTAAGKDKCVHIPVLRDAVTRLLRVREGDIALDATVDGGGHAAALLRRVGRGGKVIGVDADSKVLFQTAVRFSTPRFVAAAGNFRNLDTLLAARGIMHIDCALFDLGMSTWQLEHSGRGFSFLRDEPLLMTFHPDPEPHETAAALLRRLSAPELTRIFREYGQERFARRIADAIVARRREKPFRTTGELVAVIAAVRPERRGERLHPATQVFQALRIAVNDELAALAKGIAAAWNMLQPEGRIAVIAFHSLEDRIVKQFFRKEAKNGRARVLTKTPYIPTEAERKQNPRARSAKLRVAEKLPQEQRQNTDSDV